MRAIFAMAQYRLGEDKAARAELAQARTIIETGTKDGLTLGDGGAGYWFDWVLSRILVREATTLMGNNPGISP